MFFVLAGCSINPVTGEADFVMLSEQEEVALGVKEHPNILSKYGVYEDAELNGFVESVGQRLARKSHRSGLEFHFTVLDSEEVNAFALPGGYVYITRGLLVYLNSEAEVAAVLGHEIGHVTARHGVRQYSAAMAANVGFTLGSIFVPELRQVGAQDLFNILGGALLSGYGREHELESDRLGAEYLARSGYDPQAMIQVIRVLKNQEQFATQRAKAEGRKPQAYHGLFASHPDNDTRLKEVVGKATALKTVTTRPANRKAFYKRLDGLVFGPSEAQGIVRDTHFYHKPLGFTLEFPADWQIQNQPQSLLALAPKQKAFILLRTLKSKSGVTPQQALQQSFKLKQMQQGEVLKIAGLTGYTAVGHIKTPFGMRDSRLAIINMGSMSYIFIAATQTANELKNYDGRFLNSIRSFHRLKKNEQKLAQAMRIDIATAKPGTRFAVLAKKSPLEKYAEEYLRLLNNQYPTGEPESGKLLKIIRH